MNNYDLEKEIIGNILLDPNNIKKIIISENIFFDIKNRFIFKLLLKQYEDYKTVSIVGISENYRHLFNEKFNINEIITIMSNAMNDTVGSNIDYLQETLFDRYVKRKILDAISSYNSNRISTDELFEKIHKYESLSIKQLDNTLTEEEIFNVVNSKNKNINFKFKKLSDVANIQEHDLVVVAARPGIGKTGFLLNLIEDLSSKYNCILFNMEMNEKQVYQRLVSINTNIDMKYLDKPQSDYQLNYIKKGCKEISDKKIKIISAGQTISSIRRKIINESKQEHTLIFIDYVGLIGSSERGQSNYERVTSIVKELRQISLDYNCTIFLAAQINRNTENQKDKTPKISDLKESGELEQSATTVIMLHDENHNSNISKDEIEISVIIGKNRNGKVGITKMLYEKPTQRFKNIEKK